MVVSALLVLGLPLFSQGFIPKWNNPNSISLLRIAPASHGKTSFIDQNRNRSLFGSTLLHEKANQEGENSLPLTLSEQERRREAKRRVERKNDVKPGTTSAIKGAKDYAIDPTATEHQWMQQASAEEQEVYRLTDQGLDALKLFDLDTAVQAFQAAVDIKPNAYVWQDGIAKFYKGDIDGAARTFTRCAQLYESKFDLPATEERIFRNACNIKKYHTLPPNARKEVRVSGTLEQLVPSIPETEDTHRLMGSETRRILRLAHDLFEATLKGNRVEEAMARARIRSMGGLVGEPSFVPQLDHKLWKLQAWYYLALYHDVIEDHKKSKDCLKTALKLCPSANGADVVHALPMLHMKTRGWFDDEDIDDPLLETGFSTIEEVVENSLRNSLQSIRHVDITTALRERSLVYTGSKDMVIERLIQSLLPQIDETLF